MLAVKDHFCSTLCEVSGGGGVSNCFGSGEVIYV